MATLKNKTKFAELNKDNCEDHLGSNLEQNSNVPRSQEDHITQASQEAECGVTKKLSQDFSRTENQILGALSCLEDFLMNSPTQGHTTYNSGPEDGHDNGYKFFRKKCPEHQAFNVLSLLFSINSTWKFTKKFFRFQLLWSLRKQLLKLFQKNSWKCQFFILISLGFRWKALLFSSFFIPKTHFISFWIPPI